MSSAVSVGFTIAIESRPAFVMRFQPPRMCCACVHIAIAMGGCHQQASCTVQRCKGANIAALAKPAKAARTSCPTPCCYPAAAARVRSSGPPCPALALPRQRQGTGWHMIQQGSQPARPRPLPAAPAPAPAVAAAAAGAAPPALLLEAAPGRHAAMRWSGPPAAAAASTAAAAAPPAHAAQRSRPADVSPRAPQLRSELNHAQQRPRRPAAAAAAVPPTLHGATAACSVRHQGRACTSRGCVDVVCPSCTLAVTRMQVASARRPLLFARAPATPYLLLQLRRPAGVPLCLPSCE